MGPRMGLYKEGLIREIGGIDRYTANVFPLFSGSKSSLSGRKVIA